MRQRRLVGPLYTKVKDGAEGNGGWGVHLILLWKKATSSSVSLALRNPSLLTHSSQTA